MLLIKNAHVLDPYTGLDKKSDILINDNGIIENIADNISCDCPVLDAMGRTISTGFVDTHVHFRDPGQTQKEDIHTGMNAAAAGGYTTVVCMANTLPICDNLETLNYIKDKINEKKDSINVLQACAISTGFKGQEVTDLDALLKAGAVGFTDDGIPLKSAEFVFKAMQMAVKHDTILSFHEEAPEFVPSAGVNYGSKAAEKFGVLGAMPVSEEVMIARDIALALDTGAKVVFQHVSSARSAEFIRYGKKMGAKIYAEVTPHHISLTEDDVLEHGTLARMNPPLRKEQDRLALIDALLDGTIDMIATDHAPHTSEEKNREFAKAPSGITGLETDFSVCNTALVQSGKMSKMKLLECMSKNPAEIYGLKNKEIKIGNKAELVLLDWNKEKIYTNYQSKSCNTPFTGKKLIGSVDAVIMGDKIISF